MKSASNEWEADPWDASDEVADVQRRGFQERAAKSIIWTPIRDAGPILFGVEAAERQSTDVQFYATHDGEDMLLMQLDWHGFPDPPEWRLATRPIDGLGTPWALWGYFTDLPERWIMPNG